LEEEFRNFHCLLLGRPEDATRDKTGLILGSILPSARISAGMKNAQNNNPLLLDQIKDAVGETADQAPMNAFINYRIPLGRSLEGG
jgi:hypothetical protein